MNKIQPSQNQAKKRSCKTRWAFRTRLFNIRYEAKCTKGPVQVGSVENCRKSWRFESTQIAHSISAEREIRNQRSSSFEQQQHILMKSGQSRVQTPGLSHARDLKIERSKDVELHGKNFWTSARILMKQKRHWPGMFKENIDERASRESPELGSYNLTNWTTIHHSLVPGELLPSTGVLLHQTFLDFSMSNELVLPGSLTGRKKRLFGVRLPTRSWWAPSDFWFTHKRSFHVLLLFTFSLVSSQQMKKCDV